MREKIYQFLSPPERGTPRYRVITSVKKITDWLLFALAIPVIARACGKFDASPGTPGDYVMLAFSALFFARFAAEPMVWLLRKLAGIGRRMNGLSSPG